MGFWSVNNMRSYFSEFWDERVLTYFTWWLRNVAWWKIMTVLSLSRNRR